MIFISRSCRNVILLSALLGPWGAVAMGGTSPRPPKGLVEQPAKQADDEATEDEEDLLDEEGLEDVPEVQPPAEVPEASREAIEEINKEILETDVQIGLDGAKTTHTGTIPVEINNNVRKWIHYFSVEDHDRFQRFLDRGEVYRDLVKRTLEENGVPTELYYLAMIESGFVIQARSHASAVGPWQFIRGTGQRYGLVLAPDVDERRDIVRATQSAARYLRGLHLVFQDWFLAMAAYNAGEGRIVGAVLRGETRNFWELVEKKALPEETRDYVPKFLAAAIIGRHPERYGFTRSEGEIFPAMEGVSLRGGLALNAIAEKAGISASVLASLNPHLLQGRTPMGLREYTLWVPAGSGARVTEIASTLEVVRERPAPPVVAVERMSRLHKVRAGESLASIAKKYGLTVPKLKKLNGLKAERVPAGKRLVVGLKRGTVSMR